ncbi:MAG: hypothetical protein QFB86_02770 [Patescibacteria group bacterium]|nr:hypothetical protein [Patescibacteria group bacterium]
MARLHTTKTLITKATLTGLTACFLFLIIGTTKTVHAEAPVTDPVLAHCLKIVEGPSLKAGCRNEDTVKTTKNVATYYCNNNTKDSKAGCLTNKAIEFIDETVNSSPQPKNENDFNQKLQKVLKATGHSLTKPAKGDFGNLPAEDTSVTKGYEPSHADVCGASDKNPVNLSLSIGCKGKGNPITDAAFAIIRFLSNGVGLVIVGSLIMGGIQYAGSRDEPQSVAIATKRIQSTVIALVIYIFGYAFLNYIIPAGFLGQ